MRHRVLLALLVVLALAAAAQPVSAAPAPCSPEAMARDRRQLSAVLVWVREGARNRLQACQGQPLPQAPAVRCTTVCPGAFCFTRCEPSF